MQQSMHWAEAWLRTSSTAWQPRLRRLLGHRQRANIISEQAVWIGVTATLGLAAAVAFTTRHRSDPRAGAAQDRRPGAVEADRRCPCLL